MSEHPNLNSPDFLGYHLRKLFEIYDMPLTIENRAERMIHFEVIEDCLKDYVGKFEHQGVLPNMQDFIDLAQYALSAVKQRFCHPESPLSIDSNTAHIFCCYIETEILRLRGLAIPRLRTD